MRNFFVVCIGGTGISIGNSIKNRIWAFRKAHELKKADLGFNIEFLFFDTTSDTANDKPGKTLEEGMNKIFRVETDDFINLGGVFGDDPIFNYENIVKGGLVSLRNALKAGAGGLTPSHARAALIYRFRNHNGVNIQKTIETKIASLVSNLSANDELYLFVCTSLYGSSGIGACIDLPYYLSHAFDESLRKNNKNNSLKRVGVYIIPDQTLLESLNSPADLHEKGGRALIAMEEMLPKAMHPLWIYESPIVNKKMLVSDLFDFLYVLDPKYDAKGKAEKLYDPTNIGIDPNRKESSMVIVPAEFVYNAIINKGFSDQAFSANAFQSALEAKTNAIKMKPDSFPYFNSFGMLVNRQDEELTYLSYYYETIQKVHDKLVNTTQPSIIARNLDELISLVKKRVKEYSKSFGLETISQKIIEDVKVFFREKAGRETICLDKIIEILDNVSISDYGFSLNSEVKKIYTIVKNRIKEYSTELKKINQDYKNSLKALKSEYERFITIKNEITSHSLKYINIDLLDYHYDKNDLSASLKTIVGEFLNCNPRFRISDGIHIRSPFNVMENKTATHYGKYVYPDIHLSLETGQQPRLACSYPANLINRPDDELQSENVLLKIYTSIKFTDLQLFKYNTSNGALNAKLYDPNNGIELTPDWKDKFLILNSFTEVEPRTISNIYNEIAIVADGGVKYLMLQGLRTTIMQNLDAFIETIYTDDYLAAIKSKLPYENSRLRDVFKNLISISPLHKHTLDTLSGLINLSRDESARFIKVMRKNDRYFHLWFDPWENFFAIPTYSKLLGVDINDRLNHTICIGLMCEGCKNWGFLPMLGKHWCQSQTAVPEWNNPDQLDDSAKSAYNCFY